MPNQSVTFPFIPRHSPATGSCRHNRNSRHHRYPVPESVLHRVKLRHFPQVVGLGFTDTDFVPGADCYKRTTVMVRSPRQHNLTSSSRWRPSDFLHGWRRGTATVELAVCLPVIVILVFGSIEVSHFIHLKQDLTICAYEAAKVAAKSGKSMQDVQQRFLEIAEAKGVTDATLTVQPDIDQNISAGEEITLTALAPAESNKRMPVRYFRNRQLRAVVVMVKQTN